MHASADERSREGRMQKFISQEQHVEVSPYAVVLGLHTSQKSWFKPEFVAQSLYVWGAHAVQISNNGLTIRAYFNASREHISKVNVTARYLGVKSFTNYAYFPTTRTYKLQEYQSFVPIESLYGEFPSDLLFSK